MVCLIKMHVTRVEFGHKCLFIWLEYSTQIIIIIKENIYMHNFLVSGIVSNFSYFKKFKLTTQMKIHPFSTLFPGATFIYKYTYLVQEKLHAVNTEKLKMHLWHNQTLKQVKFIFINSPIITEVPFIIFCFFTVLQSDNTVSFTRESQSSIN